MKSIIAQFVKEKRKSLKLTQVDLAEKSGVGLRFVRELEQGKKTLRLDKVNQVLDLFGCELGPVRKEVNHEQERGGLWEIKTAAHTLIRLQSSYLTKRFDRQGKTKTHTEDLGQLTETLTEHKYRESIEKVGKTIWVCTTNKGSEVLALFELVIFCFIAGNADMHLKNFSLIRFDNGEIRLSPAYDLLSTKLAMAKDLEESALTINGKKNRLKRVDFDELAIKLGIPVKSTERVYAKFFKKQTAMIELIGMSFLSDEMKQEYTSLLLENLDRLKQLIQVEN